MDLYLTTSTLPCLSPRKHHSHHVFVPLLQEYRPCTVAVSLAFVSLHQSHDSQGLPVSFCWSAALHRTTRLPPPVATPPSPLHLHSDWLAILVHKVQLLSVSVMRRFMSLGLTRRNMTKKEIRGKVACWVKEFRDDYLLQQVWSAGQVKDRGTRSVSSLVSSFLACFTTIVLHNTAHDSQSIFKNIKD